MDNSPQSQLQAQHRLSPDSAEYMPPEPSVRSIGRAKANEVQIDSPGAGAVPHVTFGSSVSVAVEETNDISVSMSTKNMSTLSKPRRFLPQPIEESSRSTRTRNHKSDDAEAGQMNLQDSAPSQKHENITLTKLHDSQPRRFAPAPVETSSRSSRRKFAPEPVETSSRSSKDTLGGTRPQRRFAPEPVETSLWSSKDKKAQDSTSKPRRKFAPEPIETETISRRRKPKKAEPHDHTFTAEDGHAGLSGKDDEPSSRSSSGGRRFSPELIETAKGAFRQSVFQSPSKQKSSDPPSPPPEQEADDTVSELQESRFSAAALARRQHQEQRKGSLMVPALSTIESDSGDDSEAPSLTNSRSSAESERRQSSKRAVGDSYTDYVLRLAAQTKDDKELQEQAMAAYINERPYEPVAHFAFDDDDDGTLRIGKLSVDKGVDVKTFRRSSQDDLDWEMQNMRRHHEQLECAKRELKHDTAGTSRFSAAALGMRNHLEAQKQQKAKKAKAEEEDELVKMRKAASPPMLGNDIIFPFTISPKMTRCDVDHAPRPRTADSDEESDDEEADQQMWNRKVNVRKDATEGLWGGMCVQDSRPVTPTRSGIQTPAVERANPFEGTTPGRGNRTPGHRTPGRRKNNLLSLKSSVDIKLDGEDSFMSKVDKKLQIERQIDEEFSDRVITQIYNYLSLGYPSLAWAFDDELAKISRISVEELRRDDEKMDAKGYVGVEQVVEAEMGRLGEDEDAMQDTQVGAGQKEHEERRKRYAEDEVVGKCRRWEALRLYVREWARQSPGFAEEIGGVRGGKGAGWGGNAALRKGSWGN